MKSFETLSISKDQIENLKSLNYINMTPIQEKSIPLILEGRDILAQAKTGSGKTAAFGIGLLESLNIENFRVQSLILCPTRELADQVSIEIRKLAKFKHNIKIVKLTGGLPMRKQEHSLSHEAHIVVGTPGRVLKLLERGTLYLDHLNTLVLDEADRMLDMGFIDQIEDIMSFAPKKCQTLCYSATFPKEIKDFCNTFLNNPQLVEVESNHDTKVIQHFFINSRKGDKGKLTLDIIKSNDFDSVIVFCNTKDACRSVEKELADGGIETLALHGDLEQKDRTEVLILFSNGSCRVLVATDVAARGLDINNLTAVINYDLPFETETYIHRVGRTGRAGREGLSYSLLTPGEDFRLDEINKYMGTNLEAKEIELNSDKKGYREPEMVTISINGGRKNKISPGDILGALTADGEILGSDVGQIDRQDYLTFVAIDRLKANKAYNILLNGKIKGKSFKVIIHQ